MAKNIVALFFRTRCIEDRAVKFACNMEFSAMVNRMMCPPSFHLTESDHATHSRVVCFGLESNLVYFLTFSHFSFSF